MPKLPVLSGGQAVRAFEKAGWRVDRQRGSHVVMLMEGLNVSLSIPQHHELSPGTLRSLIRVSGMSVAQFIELV
jgi:predicted RNA binding protein YcfA (HicA-like mRNA interferase family)